MEGGSGHSGPSTHSVLTSVKARCREHGLPSRLDDILLLSEEHLTAAAELLGASEEELTDFLELTLDERKVRARAELKALRSRGVALCRREGTISLAALVQLRKWGDVNPNIDHNQTQGSSSLAGEALLGSSVPDSAENLELRRQLDELRNTASSLKQKVELLEAERAEDDDAASSSKLWISDQLWEDLPEDAVRAELSKADLRGISRLYPAPAEYSLKAGVLSAADKSRLPAASREQMDVLAKIILRSNDAVRPLLHLITRLDNEDSLAAGEIRTMALDSISLTLHANSILETQRKQLLFQGNKVVSALFDRQSREAKPLLSKAEEAELDALYEREKHKKKLRSVLGAPARGTQPAGGRGRGRGQSQFQQQLPRQQSGVNFGDQPGNGRGRGNFRQSGRSSGKGAKGRGSGEARGARDTSAQQE